jgi:hypothetical protein
MRTLTIVVLAAGLSAAAQSAPQPDYPARLRTVAAELEARYGEAVLVDPALRITSAPVVPRRGLTTEQAFRELAAAHRDLSWRRVHLPMRVIAPQPARLGAIARALDSVQADAAVEEPQRGRGVRWRAIASVPPGTKRVNLLYSRSCTQDGRTPAELLAKLEQEQLAVAAPPGSEGLAYLGMMEWVKAVPPAELERRLAPLHAAGMQAWEQTSAEQRRALMEGAMTLMQRAAASPRRPTPPAGSGRNHLIELRGVVKALEKRYGARMLVEPDLFVETAPRMPDARLTVHCALDELTGAYGGLAWRRVRPAPALRERPDRLAPAVRALEQVELPELTLEDPSAGTFRSFTREERQPGADTEADDLYLVYAADGTGRARAPESALLALHRRQTELIVGMEPAALVERMRGRIDALAGAGPADRSRIMGLPLIAAMMATWFPRHAKEQRGVVRC